MKPDRIGMMGFSAGGHLTSTAGTHFDAGKADSADPPGLDRVVKKEADFARFAGKRAKVKLREGIEGQRNFRGYLKGAEAGIVKMDFGGRELEFPITDIVEARLDPELKF